ncbi:unnamed protein product [Rhizophagus irregularis]|nr:unnamed protein product [Rhizophagus irregularis]
MKFIHAVRCGITRTTGMNSFSRFSSRFLEQLFTISFFGFLDDSRQFFVVSGRFLDNSYGYFWMILGRGQLLNNFWVKHHGFLDGKHRRDEISKTSETY